MCSMIEYFHARTCCTIHLSEKAKSEDRNVECYFVFDRIPISVFCFPGSQFLSLIDNRTDSPSGLSVESGETIHWRDDRGTSKGTWKNVCLAFLSRAA